MKAIQMTGHGAADVLHLGEAPQPQPGPGEVLIEVTAASVNRPDIIQREGHYPPPPGESDILGLDAAGTITAIGSGVSGWQTGERVCALLSGGGYAEFVTAPVGQLIRVPDTLPLVTAAGIPEAYLTAYQNVFLNGALRPGETVLAHGGGGGVNTAVIQLVRTLQPDSPVLVTASSGKCERVAALGATHVIDYQQESFAGRVREITGQRGVDVIIDHIGAAYFEDNLRSLAVGGRLVIIATLGGRHTELDLTRLMVKRQQVIGSVLRARSAAEKADLVARFARAAMPHFAAGAIAPPIAAVLPLAEAAEGHRMMEQSRHFGKIILEVKPE